MPDLRLCLLALALLANPAPLGHRHLGAEPADTGQPHNLILVLMADVEGWTGPELASHLCMSAGAVRSRLSRARKRLRSSIDLGPGYTGPLAL